MCYHLLFYPYLLLPRDHYPYCHQLSTSPPQASSKDVSHSFRGSRASSEVHVIVYPPNSLELIELSSEEEFELKGRGGA